MGFADGEWLEPEDLAQEVLHEAQDVGRYRALSARDHLRRLAPDCQLRPFLGALTEHHASTVLPGYQMVLDAGGDLQVSCAAAHYCQASGTPLIRSQVLGATALVWTVLTGAAAACPHQQPCPGAPAPAFASIAAGVAGSLAAGEALRILLGEPPQLAEEVLIFEALTGRVTRSRRSSGADCPHCTH